MTAVHDADISSYILVGDYGSGKTEVAVNLTLELARQKHVSEGRRAAPSRTGDQQKKKLAIADLDLVNPYFRCREAQEPLEQAGVRVVMPQGSHQYADLPILLPQVKGLLQDEATLSVLDVGGDEVGSRVLAGLSPAFSAERHHFLFVVNANRPFNDTIEGVERTIARIEAASGLRVTGLISNTHLMQETTGEMVVRGAALAAEVAAARGVPVLWVAAMEDVVEALDEGALPAPLLVMRRIMVPPWLRRQAGDAAVTRLGTG